MKDVPVLMARFWSKAKVKAYRLADNQLARAATWDEDLLRVEIASIIELDETPIEILDWSTGEIDVLLDGGGIEDDDIDPDDALPEPPATPVAQVGDLWLLGRHRLLCASSLEPSNWERLMAGNVAAMILTDAPYNVRVNGHVSGGGQHAEFAIASGEMSEAEFIRFNVSYLANMAAHLKDGGIAMAFMDHHHLFELMTAAREVGFKHLNLCVWAKTNGGMGSLYRSQHELVMVLKHGTAPHTNMVELGKHGRYRTNVWSCAGANAFGANRDADLADGAVKATAHGWLKARFFPICPQISRKTTTDLGNTKQIRGTDSGACLTRTAEIASPTGLWGGPARWFDRTASSNWRCSPGMVLAPDRADTMAYAQAVVDIVVRVSGTQGRRQVSQVLWERA